MATQVEGQGFDGFGLLNTTGGIQHADRNETDTENTYEERINRVVALKAAANLCAFVPTETHRERVEQTLKTAEVFTAWLGQGAV